MIDKYSELIKETSEELPKDLKYIQDKLQAGGMNIRIVGGIMTCDCRFDRADIWVDDNNMVFRIEQG